LTSDPNIDIRIVAGKKLNQIQVFESKSEKISSNLKNYSFIFKNHRFYWQKGLFKSIKELNPTNVIIGGPDFHFLSTIFLSLYLLNFTKIKVHFWTHGLSKSNSKIKFKFTKYLYKKASSILTYEKEGKVAIAKKMGIEKIKIIAVKNCLNDWDYGFNKTTKKFKKEESKLNILFSGRLTNQKRVDILIKAIGILVKEDVPINCIIIGDGLNKMYLEELTNELSLNEVVKFKGALYDADVEVYFKAADLFVLPGKVGLSIVHALSYGLPIITTNLPIHSPEVAILTQDNNAFFFKGESPEELAKTLMKYSQQEPNDKAFLKSNCIESVIQNGYIPERMKRNFINALKY
jgi:glycosyltransferase involved in cell wall biosynthesis